MNVKPNLKFVIGNNRNNKASTKNISTNNGYELSNTINLNTNSKVTDKVAKKNIELKTKSYDRNQHNALEFGATGNFGGGGNQGSGLYTNNVNNMNNSVNVNNLAPNFIKKIEGHLNT